MPTVSRVVVLPQNTSTLRIDEVTLPDPGPYQVIVKQFSSGICHSQLHQIHNAQKEPVILGHESTGIVLSAGSAVTHVREGDHVMVTWMPRNAAEADRPPEAAKIQLPNGDKAQSMNVFTWADHSIVDEQYVVAIPNDIPTDVTAIVGCAVMTGAGAIYNSAKVQAGESVAIFGVGGVGLAAVAAARIVGADPIIAIDLDEAKLDFARNQGATIGINASQVEPVSEIHRITGRPGMFNYNHQPVTGVDYAFDCIGHRTTTEQSLAAVRPSGFGQLRGGIAVAIGVPPKNFEIDIRDIFYNEKSLIGSIGGSCIPDRDFPMFLHWYKEGKIDLNTLVTRRFRLDEINEATTELEQGKIAGRAILEFSTP